MRPTRRSEWCELSARRLPLPAVQRGVLQAAHRRAPGHPHRQGLSARRPGRRSRAGATKHWTAGSMPGPPPPSAASIAGRKPTGAMRSNGTSGGRRKRSRPPPGRAPSKARPVIPKGPLAAGSPADARTGSAVQHGGRGGTAERSQVTRWMAANVAVAQDPAGNLKPAKDKPTERIDGIVALDHGHRPRPRRPGTSHSPRTPCSLCEGRGCNFIWDTEPID